MITKFTTIAAVLLLCFAAVCISNKHSVIEYTNDKLSQVNKSIVGFWNVQFNEETTSNEFYAHFTGRIDTSNN